MKKILLMLFIMVAIISNNAKAQFNYYASVEGGGGSGTGGGGASMIGGTGTISYGEKLEWGFTSGLRSYLNVFITEEYSGQSESSAILIVPLILSSTYNFNEIRSMIPFVSINGGYGIKVNSLDAVMRSNYYTLGGEAGVKHKNIKASIFYINQGYIYYIYQYSGYSVGDGRLNTVGAKITYCFNGVRKDRKTE
jgi:hypothetical protein